MRTVDRLRSLPVFAHLHTHTEFSLLDGMSRIPALMDRVLALGQPAVAITDHGGMYGVIEFYKEAKKRGIKPILGVEAYLAPGSRLSRDPREKNAYYHFTLLARNAEGYRNLVALTSKAHLEGYYYKPRMDRELLHQHRKGIIALSGCPSGEVFKALMSDNEAEARRILGEYTDLFDAVGIEIQDHNGADAELRGLLDKANPGLIKLSKQTGLPLVATNDLHYVAPEDAEPHDVLLCIGTSATVHDTKRMRLEGGSYYLKSREEMLALPVFQAYPEAVDNTLRIAEMVDIELEFGRIPFPDIDMPPGMNTDEYLAQVCYEGLQRRYGQDLGDTHRQRLAYELDVIKKTGFAAYMLLVAEIVGEARKRKIPTGVRGSAAASIVLYCLGVTNIDPIGPKLVFERFLHAERKDMPDVDLDIADERRDELIQWAAERWGRDRVAQIATFGTLGAKAAIRDVGRALGMPLPEVDRVARLVPTVLHMTLDKALEESAELRQVYEVDPSVRRLVDTARKLEGVSRHASTHAAGVIIAGVPLYDVAPLQKISKGGEDALPMVQFDMNIAQEIGLIKMDFLGLSNLTILGRAIDLIKQYEGVDLDLVTLPDGDEKTYKLLGEGETFGVFQLESSGMRRYIQELKPASVAELAAMVALYRPGPLAQIPNYIGSKWGRQEVRYPHPDLGDILDETYGVIVYQDQVLFIMWKFAGYTMGEADKIRKAMGKKIASVMAAERDKFVQGAVKQGYKAEDATAIFDLVEPFAGYAFNKSHAVCYATISYQTAYLKANYAAEYMTAVLMLAGSAPNPAERVGAAVAECAKLGIKVLQPDVNHSESNFCIETDEEGKKSIRFGLATIKNVGEGPVEELLEERRKNGPYANLEEFCRRAPAKAMNKRVLECMAKAGALDCFGYSRATLLFHLDRITSFMQKEQKLKDSGQVTMFEMLGGDGDAGAALQLEPVEGPKQEALQWERELLGVYVSDHPFGRAVVELGAHVTHVITEITAEISGREVMVAGLVASVRQLLTRDGRAFLAIELEDLSGSIEITVWPDVYEATREHWVVGQIVLVSARVRAREDRLSVGVITSRRWYEGQGLEQLPEAEIVNESARSNGNGRNGNGGGYSNGNGRNGNGNGGGGYARNGNGNGGGYRNGNGNGYQREAPPPPPVPTSERAPRLLHITVRETDDESLDRRRLKDLVQAIRAYPGTDEVRLTVRTEHDEHNISLGTALVTDNIQQRLGEVLRGWAEISVTPLASVPAAMVAAARQ